MLLSNMERGAIRIAAKYLIPVAKRIGVSPVELTACINTYSEIPSLMKIELICEPEFIESFNIVQEEWER